MTQFGTMCLKCGQDVWNIYAWPKLSSDIVSHSLQGSSFHFQSWAQYWLCGSCSVWGLDERTPVKDNTSVLAPQFLNRSSSRMWLISNKRWEMIKAESLSKIAAVWEGTSDVRMLLIIQLLRLLRFPPLYCSSQVAQPAAHPQWQRVPQQESGLPATNWLERSTNENKISPCVYIWSEKRFLWTRESQSRDQNLGITCLEINNQTVKQCQCLWTGNLVSKQDFVTKRSGDSH